MAVFSKKHIDFLRSELGLSEEQIKSMNKDEWLSYREKCFDIEVEESLKAANSEDEENYNFPEREKIALELLEIPLSKLGF